MTSVKQVLQDFAQATGLIVNYSKTTFLPIALEAEYATSLVSLLETGLLLPSTVLRSLLDSPQGCVANFSPLISSCDRYLAGWKASLLNRAGRLVLATSVLSSLPLHYMSALLVPRTVIKAIDKRRRAFFWTGEDKCHGSKCLIAWEHVCKHKNQGGLDLETQNHCLLLKFVDKILNNSPAPWKDWVLRNTIMDGGLSTSSPPSFL